MAYKSKIELKDVFNGANSLLYQSEIADLSTGTFTLKPEYDLPVTVDTLQLSQDDPTINHYKVIGLDGDWTSSATLGDMTFQFTVPTKAKDVLVLAYGTDAVKDITKGTVSGTSDSDIDGDYAGHAVILNKKKVTGTFAIVDEEKTNIMVIAGAAVWAKPLYENVSTEPFAIQFTGTIENAGTQSMAWLKKSTTTVGG